MGQFWCWTVLYVSAYPDPHFAVCAVFILLLVIGHHLIQRL